MFNKHHTNSTQYTMEETEWAHNLGDPLDNYYRKDVEEDFPLLDAVCWVQENDVEKAMFIYTDEENPSGMPKAEVVYRLEGYKHGGITRWRKQLRGDIDLVDVLLKGLKEPVEVTASTIEAHYEIRDTLQHLVFWSDPSCWEVDVTFSWKRDEYWTDRIEVDPEDPFATEFGYKRNGKGLAFVWVPMGRRYLVSGDVCKWYENVEFPPAPFVWKYEDMTEEERQKVEDNPDHYQYAGDGVWTEWYGVDIRKTDIHQVIINIAPKDTNE